MDPLLYKTLHQYDRATPDTRNYSGTILLDGQEVAQTLQCCHCNKHFLNVKIPGKERGWCMNCSRPVCADPRCDRCLPFEQWLDNIERNLPPGHKPIVAAIHAALPTS